MGLFNKNPNEAAFAGGKKNWADVIKNTSTASYLLWKQPEEDFNNNSTLIVDPGEAAIFIKDGHIEQVADSGKHKLDTENYPFLTRFRTAFTGGISEFNCKIYFVRTAHSMEVTWGGSVSVEDPVYGIVAPVKGFGAFKVQVDNPVILLKKMVGSRADLTQDGLKDYFQNNFQQRITDAIGNSITESGKEIIAICSNKTLVAERIFPVLDEVINAYGLKLTDFSVANLAIPEDDPSFVELKSHRSKAAAFKVYGDKWGAQQQVDIMKTMAANEGAGGAAAAAGAGIGMGMAAAGGMFGMMNPMMNQMQQQPQQQQQQQQPAQQPAAATGPVEKIKQLKEMLDLGVLTQEEFDAKKAEILSSM